jgi:hypothetical protein
MCDAFSKWMAAMLACLGCASSESPAERMKTAMEKAERAIKKIESLGGSVLWEREIFVISLPNTSTKDEDLAVLSDLSDVEILDLSNTAVTDSCLGYLEQLKKLETLYLVNTRISAEGVEKLRTSLPNAAIHRVEPPMTIDPFKPGSWTPDE